MTIARAGAIALAVLGCGDVASAQARPAADDTVSPAGKTGLDGNGHLKAVVQGDGAFAYARLVDGVQVRVGGVTKNLIFYGPATVRVNANLGENYWTARSLAVIGKPQAVPFRISETAATLTIASAKLRIEVSKATGALRFFDAAGKLYTEEKADAPQALKKVEISGAPTLEASNAFTLRPDEAIYGLGFNAEDHSNRRGKELLLVQTNVGIIIPVLMSSRRYGVMWDTYSQMRFKDDAGGASMWAESAPGGVDYYFMAGNTPDAVVGAYRALTGQAPMYPKQAFGLFMSKERYKTQDHLHDVARTFRKQGIPQENIVKD
jgi:alpha-D-xyloside xylohydrolase